MTPGHGTGPGRGSLEGNSKSGRQGRERVGRSPLDGYSATLGRAGPVRAATRGAGGPTFAGGSPKPPGRSPTRIAGPQLWGRPAMRRGWVGRAVAARRTAGGAGSVCQGGAGCRNHEPRDGGDAVGSRGPVTRSGHAGARGDGARRRPAAGWEDALATGRAPEAPWPEAAALDRRDRGVSDGGRILSGVHVPGLDQDAAARFLAATAAGRSLLAPPPLPDFFSL